MTSLVSLNVMTVKNATDEEMLDLAINRETFNNDQMFIKCCDKSMELTIRLDYKQEQLENVYFIVLCSFRAHRDDEMLF